MERLKDRDLRDQGDCGDKWRYVQIQKYAWRHGETERD